MVKKFIVEMLDESFICLSKLSHDFSPRIVNKQEEDH